MKSKKGETLKRMDIRVPRDWHHRVKTMADSRRMSMTAIIFHAVEKEWIRFKKEEAYRKKLESQTDSD